MIKEEKEGNNKNKNEREEEKEKSRKVEIGEIRNRRRKGRKIEERGGEREA